MTFYFSQLVMNPRSFVVVTQNTTLYNTRFPPNSRGDYIGKLTSKGKVSLLDFYGSEVWTLKYDTVAPWPAVGTSDRSLVTITTNPTSALNDPAMWRLSTNVGGSPGTDGECFKKIYVMLRSLYHFFGNANRYTKWHSDRNTNGNSKRNSNWSKFFHFRKSIGRGKWIHNYSFCIVYLYFSGILVKKFTYIITL